MFCSTCSRNLAAGVAFCTECGSAAPRRLVRSSLAAPPNALRVQSKAQNPFATMGLMIGGALFLSFAVIIVGGLGKTSRRVSSNLPAVPSPQTSAPLPIPPGMVVVNQDVLCGSTPKALDEMTKWAVRGDNQEGVRVMMRTGSGFVNKGDLVEVIHRGFMTSKVRIIGSGRECWVASEFVR